VTRWRPLPRRGALAQAARHQLASIGATLLDFAWMTALVELASARPSLATLVGSASGALFHFTLSRRWVFPGHQGPWQGQALRYALISGGSALWNGLGVELGERVGVPYLASRALVAVIVSVAWNFPMHRSFVFRSRLEAS
jgi:putative flippase GtrA